MKTPTNGTLIPKLFGKKNIKQRVHLITEITYKHILGRKKTSEKNPLKIKDFKSFKLWMKLKEHSGHFIEWHHLFSQYKISDQEMKEGDVLSLV